VTSLAAARDGDTRAGARIGLWWGVGHAAVLLVVGLPLIALQAALPAWLEATAETLIGAVIAALALRVLWRWSRGAYRVAPHRHPPAAAHRTTPQALGIGALHGLAGTGSVVVLLIAALPTPGQALVALTVFAPVSVASMTACTAAFSWLLTRRGGAGALHHILVPTMGVFGVVFGVWYAGLA